GVAGLHDVDNPALGPNNSPRLGEAAQVSSVKTRIELKCVADLRQGRVALIGPGMSEPPLEPRDDCQRICVQRRLIAEGPALEPVVMKLDPLHVEAVETEGMHVAMPKAGPVDELDPELL